MANRDTIKTYEKNASFTAREAFSLFAFYSVMLDMDTYFLIYLQHIRTHNLSLKVKCTNPNIELYTYLFPHLVFLFCPL